MSSASSTTAERGLLPHQRERSGSLFRFLLSELKPKGKLLTPFNVITAPIILTGAVLIVLRFAFGLGAVTNLSQAFPWGIWIGFDVVTGVAFAGGAYVVTFMVYILGIKAYHPIIRATVLNGFLAYGFYAGALLLDLGRPWNVVNPIIGNGFGVSSVMFVVAWHFLLYMICELLEFSPAIAEWLGWKKARRILHGLTLGAVIFGITLSTLHQAGLGGLFLMAPSKIHPLWYTEYLPILFFVSSTFAGLSLVIIEGSISHKVFAHQLKEGMHERHDRILFGLAKACAGAMFAYLFLKVLALINADQWALFGTGWGAWWLLEVLGFVALPMVLFVATVRLQSRPLMWAASVLTLLGIVLNRLNTSVIAFKWDAANHYVPSWMEIVITLAIVLVEIWVFRWFVNRLPVLRDKPAWQVRQEAEANRS